VQVRGDAPSDALDRAVSEGVAQAVLLGIDARAARPWRLAFAAALAARITRLGPDLDALRAFQRDPGGALIANRDDRSARGAAMFVDFLTARNDLPDLPLLRRLAWIPIARTPEGLARFSDEPDVFDVLGRLFRDQRGGLEGMLVEFAVARG